MNQLHWSDTMNVESDQSQREEVKGWRKVLKSEGLA